MARIMAERHRYWLREAVTLIASSVMHGLMVLNVWRWRAYSRRALSRMEQQALRDIGITETERDLECRKRFWQA